MPRSSVVSRTVTSEADINRRRRRSDPTFPGITAMIEPAYRDPAPTYDRWNDASEHIFQTKNNPTSAPIRNPSKNSLRGFGSIYNCCIFTTNIMAISWFLVIRTWQIGKSMLYLMCRRGKLLGVKKLLPKTRKLVCRNLLLPYGSCWLQIKYNSGLSRSKLISSGMSY